MTKRVKVYFEFLIVTELITAKFTKKQNEINILILFSNIIVKGSKNIFLISFRAWQMFKGPRKNILEIRKYN